MIPSGLVIGYHGCDLSFAEAVTMRTARMKPSRNAYDWLGHGIYFWQNDPRRALEWAVAQARQPGSQIKKPAILGATIELGNCFVAAQRKHIDLLAQAYEQLRNAYHEAGRKMPRNLGRGWANRRLDCEVFEMMHRLNEADGNLSFDTVLSYFPEGRAVYPDAAIRSQDHVQICVRNERQILGWHLPTF